MNYYMDSYEAMEMKSGHYIFQVVANIIRPKI